jgi:hypothetical protein
MQKPEVGWLISKLFKYRESEVKFILSRQCIGDTTRHHKHAGPANIAHLPIVSTHCEHQNNPFQSKQSKHFHQSNRFS